MADIALIAETRPSMPRLLSLILRAAIVLPLPVLLALISVRLVMTPLFLQIEYPRPGFPADYYGFTTADRLQYAPHALDYLLNGDDIDYLGDMRFPNGERMYNTRELHHMRDVKIVTQIAFLLAFGLGIEMLVTGFILYRTQRAELYRALFGGALLTLAIIATIVVIAIINWDYFFTAFHTLFFASGTWRFEYSDTLIRLFPEQFWFDAALVIGGITVTAAGIILLFSWRLRK